MEPSLKAMGDSDPGHASRSSANIDCPSAERSATKPNNSGTRRDATSCGSQQMARTGYLAILAAMNPL